VTIANGAEASAFGCNIYLNGLGCFKAGDAKWH